MPYNPSFPDFVGQQIDQYYVLRYLGEGSSGVVYLAKYLVQDSQVAIKILYQRLTTTTISAFITEAQAVLLEHPHIVRIKKFGQHEQYPYFVMPYLARGNLRQVHPSRHKLKWETVLPYIRQITDALQYVHTQGLVHRDIKPENMLLDEHGKILLSDFGISVTSHTINPEMQLAYGTPNYIAPEQILGRAVRASDQYSLGIVMYEWLTGELPFVVGRSSSPGVNLLDLHLRAPVKPLRNIDPTINPLVEALVLKMLEKRPEQRFASMSEFLVEVERITLSMSPTVVITQPRIQTFSSHTHAVQTLAWSPDGKYIASAGHDTLVHVWDALTGQILSSYHGHTSTVWSLAWSHDSRTLVSVGSDEMVHIWEATTGSMAKVLTEEQQGGILRTVVWSPKGDLVATAGDEATVHVWNVQNRAISWAYGGYNQAIYCLAWSPDAAYLASGDAGGIVRIWSVVAGSYVRVYRRHSERVTSLAWSPNGKYLVSASEEGSFHIWETETGRVLVTCKEHGDAVTSVAWSPDGRYLASGSWDQTVRVWTWDAAQGVKALQTSNKHNQWVTTVAWSIDGSYIASGSWDKTVQITARDTGTTTEK